MSKKSKLKRAIDDSEREIEALEQKRERSQIAVLRAMISGTKPSPEDEQYFMVFSSLIDEEREHLRQLNAELQQLESESKKKKKKEKKSKGKKAEAQAEPTAETAAPAAEGKENEKASSKKKDKK